MRPETPTLDVIFAEFFHWLAWWLNSSFWHDVLFAAVLSLLLWAFCKALAATDSTEVRRLVREMRDNGQLR